MAKGKANLVSSITYAIHSNGVFLGIHNRSETAFTVGVFDLYTHRKVEFKLEPDGELSEFWSLDRSYGWYDFRITTRSDPGFQHRLAGHLETGRDSMTDPAIGTVEPHEQARLNQIASVEA
jgi:phospholipase C